MTRQSPKNHKQSIHPAIFVVGCLCLPCLVAYLPFQYLFSRCCGERPRKPTYPRAIPEPLEPRSVDSVLTLPIHPPSESTSEAESSLWKRKRTIPQTQCSLMTVLPPEIRKLIWEECLGGMTFHLTYARYVGAHSSKHVHIVCQNPGSLSHESCFTRWAVKDSIITRNIIQLDSTGRQEHKYLSLLLTCREVYSEAISCFYSNNTFDTVASNVRYFPKLLLPQRLNSIRSLHFKWEFLESAQPYPPGSPRHVRTLNNIESPYLIWLKTWEVLAGMESLSVLRINLLNFFCNAERQTLSTEEMTAVLEPIINLKPLSTFDLLLERPLIPVLESAMAGLPCSVEIVLPA